LPLNNRQSIFTTDAAGISHITDLSVAVETESAARCGRANGAKPCRATHTLPPIIYTPAPPRPKKTERRRGAWSVKGKRAADDVDATEEAGETSNTAPARTASPLPQHSIPVDATERRIHSTTGNLSEGTLKALLEVQEQESAKGGGGAPVVAKD
jgi:hypothetical protein